MKHILLFALGVILLFDISKLLFYRMQKLPEITQTSQTFGEGRELAYIAAGDSTALGLGATSDKETYTYLVAQNLGDKNKVTYRNLGVSGAQTEDVIKNQLTQIIDSNPQIITLSVGANDATHFKSKDSIIENFRTIKDELLSKTDADIYIGNIPSFSNAQILPIWFRKLLDLKIMKINKEISTLESDRFHIVDIYYSIPYTPETYAEDKFHPSNEGYKNWANAYLKSIFNETNP